MTLDGPFDASGGELHFDPAGEDVAASMTEVATAEDWLALVRERPSLIGLEQPTQADLHAALRAASEAHAGSPVALDAGAAGMLSTD